MHQDAAVRVFIGFEEREKCLLSKVMGVRREERGTTRGKKKGSKEGGEGRRGGVNISIATWSRVYGEKTTWRTSNNKNKSKKKAEEEKEG